MRRQYLKLSGIRRKADVADRGEAEIVRTCPRCGESTKLGTILPRFGDYPTYHLFECAACGYVEWVARQGDR
jgi:ribosomal protein S27AE